jgi:Prp8 binding protein
MKNGHENAILDIKWTADSGLLCSASADQTVALWDCESGLRIKRFKGHSGVVNSVAIAGPSSSIASSIDMIISGSDDGLVKVWDSRQKFAVCNLDMGGSPITSVAYAAGRIFAGSTDNTIACWDWKSCKLHCLRDWIILITYIMGNTSHKVI